MIARWAPLRGSQRACPRPGRRWPAALTAELARPRPQPAGQQPRGCARRVLRRTHCVRTHRLQRQRSPTPNALRRVRTSEDRASAGGGASARRLSGKVRSPLPRPRLSSPSLPWAMCIDGRCRSNLPAVQVSFFFDLSSSMDKRHILCKLSASCACCVWPRGPSPHESRAKFRVLLCSLSGPTVCVIAILCEPLCMTP